MHPRADFASSWESRDDFDSTCFSFSHGGGGEERERRVFSHAKQSGDINTPKIPRVTVEGSRILGIYGSIDPLNLLELLAS